MKFFCLLSMLVISAVGVYSQDKTDTASVYFPFNQYILTLQSKSSIDALISSWRHKQGRQIQIKGHCDSIGSNPYNDRLSEKRAEAVRQYLLQHGIATSDISFIKGYGKRLPVNDNRTPAERKMNRRVELVWIDADS